MFGRNDEAVKMWGRERKRKRWQRESKQSRPNRSVILGPSEQAMGSPAGTALPGLRPLQTDCSNLHWQSCQRRGGLPHGDGCRPGRKERKKRSGEDSRNEQREKAAIRFVGVVVDIILSTHSYKTVSSTIRGFSLSTRDQKHSSTSPDFYPCVSPKAIDENSLAFTP